MEFAGKDATAAFEGEGHSVDAIKIKEEYYIGEVKKSSSIPLIIFAALVVGLIGFCNFM